MKDQIFISHATPEDNEFTIWIASRLEMLGYKVWIDKKELLGGERFWPTIQIKTSLSFHHIIRHLYLISFLIVLVLQPNYH